MKLRVIAPVYSILKKRYHELLETPEYASVRYHKGEDGSVSYALIEYSTRYAQFAKFVSTKIQEQLHEPMGVFTRKHSVAFLMQLEKIVADVTPVEASNFGERYKTWVD